jgi:hypothetical protein
MHPSVRDAFSRDLRIAQDAVRSGVVAKRSIAATKHWERWLDFCTECAVDPWFPEGDDPIPYLQVFAVRYRDGRIAPRGKSVRSGTVSDALRAIGQTYRSVGAPDIRLDTFGAIDFRVTRQLRSYGKEDPPPDRVKPVPIQVIVAVLVTAYATADAGSQCVADLCCIGFFFLLRPGEHTYAPDNRPFHLADVKLFIGNRRLDLHNDPDADLQAATNVSLVFTTQKNGVRGEVISHGRSGHVLVCPVRAVIRRIIYLRQRNSPSDTPLCTYFTGGGRARHVLSKDITDALRNGIITVGSHTLDISPHEVEARSLRAGGATALLCADVDSDTIRLLGRWKSDAMIRYLHAAALPTMNRFASLMFSAGQYSFAAGTYAPAH